MKASELAQVLLDAATKVGDYDVECRNVAGDFDDVEGIVANVVTSGPRRGVSILLVTTDVGADADA